eukprot:4323904-Amphidinium_carterae.1
MGRTVRRIEKDGAARDQHTVTHGLASTVSEQKLKRAKPWRSDKPRRRIDDPRGEPPHGVNGSST